MKKTTFLSLFAALFLVSQVAYAEGVSFTRNLSMGSSGPDVITLQTLLEQKGYLNLPFGIAKGYFGGLTRSALMRFQSDNSIQPAVGYFGPLTQSKIVGSTIVSNTTTVNTNQNNPTAITLSAFSPSSGKVGSTITATGSGFGSKGTVVNIYFVKDGQTYSAGTQVQNDTTLTFEIPPNNKVICSTVNGMNGPCHVEPGLVSTGTYQVYVSNGYTHLKSNSVDFTVTN